MDNSLITAFSMMFSFSVFLFAFWGVYIGFKIVARGSKRRKMLKLMGSKEGFEIITFNKGGEPVLVSYLDVSADSKEKVRVFKYL